MALTNYITGSEPISAILLPKKAVNGVVVENDIITGLTIRQHFAAMAMQGLCNGKKTNDIMSGQCVDIAQCAVEIADCLIAELNKESEVSNG